MKTKLIEAYEKESVEVYNPRLGVIFNGENNMEPVVVENLIDSSPTASQCAWIYETFLGGGGFETDLSAVNIAPDGSVFPYSPVHFLFDVCEPLSKHQAIPILICYNALYEKDHFKIIPNHQVRFGKKDSNDYAGKILVSKKGWGRHLKKDEIDVFDVYNPNPDVIEAQVEAAGGWDNYKGQILYFNLSNKSLYGRSLILPAYTFADTENQLGLYYNSTTKRSFEDITIVRHKAFDKESDKVTFYKNLKELSGLENSSSKFVLEDEWNDETKETGKYKFDTIKNEVKPDKFAHFEQASANYIRKVFKNIPSQLVDYVTGKLGNTSGEDLVKAQGIYNSYISRDQEKIEILFRELFRNYKEDINPQKLWTIKQYKLMDDGVVNYTV